jgi:hypothetical protein
MDATVLKSDHLALVGPENDNRLAEYGETHWLERCDFMRPCGHIPGVLNVHGRFPRLVSLVGSLFNAVKESSYGD